MKQKIFDEKQETTGNIQKMLNEFQIRPAAPADAPALFGLIAELAEYEKLTHLVTGDAEALSRDLAGERPAIEALLAEVAGRPVGYAIWFGSYSTFLTSPGLYLEDIFVKPEHRGRGIGKGLMREVIRVAARRGCGRMEWAVLDWNAPAIEFYRALGASMVDGWSLCRLTGEDLVRLAE